MATKEGEAPIHVNVPKSWVEDIDWAIRHENEKSGRFPKMTRTDAVKNAISLIAEDARKLRKEEEARAVAMTEWKKIDDIETEAEALQRSKPTRLTRKRLDELRVVAEDLARQTTTLKRTNDAESVVRVAARQKTAKARSKQ